MVDKIIRTSQFNRAYKKLKKDHKEDIIKDINKIVDRLANFEITSQKRNHPLKGKKNKGLEDIHIRGDVILLYKYESNILTITLVLENIVNHDELKRDY